MYNTKGRALGTIWLVTMVVGGLILLPGRVGRAADDNSRYFSQTGHSVSGKFLDYWNNNGGLAVFGYPITDPQMETDPETRQQFLTQWFERNRFELHPENAGTPYGVLLGLLGKDLRRQALPVDPDFQPLAAPPSEVGPNVYIAETRHLLNEKFVAYWNTNGGLPRFGYPISEARRALDPQTGQIFLTQWFERARFEVHPENEAPYDVLLGLLGNQIKRPTSSTDFVWHVEAGLNTPLSVAVQSSVKDGPLIYVGDRQNARIQVFSSTGYPVRQWGSLGNGPGQFTSPNGIAIDDQNNVYVADGRRGELTNQNHRIQKFDANGKFLLSFGAEGNGPGQFTNPWDIAVGPDGNLYVTDENNGVQIFDNTGQYKGRVGSFGLADDEIKTPLHVTVDKKGTVYVADDRFIGNGKATPSVARFDKNGVYQGRLHFPTADVYVQGLAVDANNTLYIATYVGVYYYVDGNPKAALLFTTGGKGVAGRVGGATGIAVDADFNLFITDALNRCLFKFLQRG